MASKYRTDAFFRGGWPQEATQLSELEKLLGDLLLNPTREAGATEEVDAAYEQGGPLPEPRTAVPMEPSVPYDDTIPGKAPAPKNKMKMVLTELLPYLLTGGIGAAAGGGMGALSMMGGYGQGKQQLDMLQEQRKQTGIANLLKRMQMEVDLRKAEEANKTRIGAAQIGAEATKTAAKTRAESAASLQEDAQLHAKDMLDLQNAGVDISAIINGDYSSVPRNLAGAALNVHAAAQRAAEQRELTQSEGKLNREARATEGAMNRGARIEAARVGAELKDMPTATASKFEDLGSLYSTLKQIKKDLPTLKPLMGRVQGTWTSAKQWLGTGISTEQEAAMANVQKFFNVLAKATSGGAVTPSEEARIKRELGTMSISPEMFEGRLQVQMDFIRKKIEAQKAGLGPAHRTRAEAMLKASGATDDAEQRVVNGVMYEKGEDGLWHKTQ